MWSRWKKRQESVTISSATLKSMDRLRTLQGHSMVVVDNTMYVDGGRYYTGDGFPEDEGKIFEFQNRANISDLWVQNDLIFAFDMTKTLGPNSTTAEFLLPYTQTIKKTEPANSGWGGQTHFNPIDKKSFIQVGGFPWDEKEPEIPFWKYGESSGFGNDFKIEDKKKAAELFNMYDATTAVSPDGKLFMLGGVDYNGDAPSGGARLAMYDMKTGEVDSWPANGGNLTVPRGANLRGGQMLWFPYGEKGVLVSFGGVIWRGQENVPNSMKRIMVFDIASEKWFSQGASGGLSDKDDDFPKDRSHFCAASPSPQENRTSYEIVFYGGLNAETLNSAFDDVWSLTIPTFQWTKYYSFNDAAFGKYNRSCALVNDKYYGFVDYGSTDGGSLLSFWDITKNSDSNNGLDNGGWTRFDAEDDEPYEPPLQVVTTIGSSDSPPAGWAPGLASVFNTTVYETKDSSSFNASAPASESSSSASATPAASSSSSKTGPIVGGVVGGVVVLALLGVLIFFLIRRKKQKQQGPHNNAYFNEQPQPPMAGPPIAELDQGHMYQELDNPRKGVVETAVVGGAHVPSPDSAPRVELYGSVPYQQMEGQNRQYPQQAASPGHYGAGPGGVPTGPGSGTNVSPQSPTEMGVPELHGGRRYSRTG